MLQITPRKIINFSIYYYFFIVTGVTLLGFPISVYYILDLAMLLLLIFIIKRILYINKLSYMKSIKIVFIFLIFITFLGDIVNFVPLQLVILGIRNLYRFFILFWGILIYWKKQDIENFMNFCFIFQVFNLLVGLYKYFILGLWGDSLGGSIFTGGGGLNHFCLLLVSYYTVAFFNKNIGWNKFGFIILSVFILGALAEEKMLIISSSFCIGVGYLFICSVKPKINFRRFIVILFILAVIPILYCIINKIAPDILNTITSIDNILEVGKVSFDEGYRIPRIGAFQFINEKFLQSNLLKIFGLGLGNCDSAGIEFLQSDFYKIYGDYNYRWFTHQWTYLECGSLGFASYILFFITVILSSLKLSCKIIEKKVDYLLATASYATVVIIMMWHDSGLRTECGVFIFTGLAMGFAMYRQELIKERK